MKKITVAILLALGIYIFQFNVLSAKTAILDRSLNYTQRERHMMLFSENAFYYSYFYRLVSAPSMSEGLKELSTDDRFTYPQTVNSVRRFNIWQEVLSAGLYRMLSPRMEPVIFYAYCNIAMVATIPPLIFLAVTFLSSRILLGIGGFAAYFSLMYFSTRVYSYPSLRENFGLPFILLTGILTLFYIRKPKSSYLPWIGFSTVAQGVFWQFSMVLTALKTGALFVFWLFNKNEKLTVQRLCLVDLAAYLVLIFVFLGNYFYINPMYLAPVIVLLFLTFYRHPNPAVNAAVFVCASIVMYFTVNKLLGLNESSHMTAFFLDKYFGIKTFFSQLYLVVPAFNSISQDMIIYFTKNLLLPVFGAGLIIMGLKFKIKTIRNFEIFLFLLMSAYLMLGIVISRFIIIGLPLVVIFSFLMLGALMDPRSVSGKFISHLSQAISILILMGMAVVFALNLKEIDQRAYAHVDRSMISLQERLSREVGPSDVIAADMTISSSLALMMDNPQIIHPQYEYADNRQRSKIFNRAYGYTSSEYMHEFFNSLGADYVILQHTRCFNPVQNGINMRDAIHIDFPKQTQDLFCGRDFTGSLKFMAIEQNNRWRILKVL